jgi:Uncharacterized protein conserved in bacteria (DUF2130)/Rad50 zinc hook motif
MNNIETVNARSTKSGRHTHRTQSEADRCPLCGSPISAETRARLDEKLRAQLASAEQTLRDEFAREQQQAATRAAAELAKAKAEAERARKQILEREAPIRRAAVKKASAELASKVAEAVAAERSKMLSEKVALEQKVSELQRRLRAEPAQMIGDPAEQDLHTRLAQSFPIDQLKVSRVGKGVRGPDLFLEILEGGACIGRIAVESKQTARWSSKFISKLKTDAEGAEFAVLSARSGRT